MRHGLVTRVGLCATLLLAACGGDGPALTAGVDVEATCAELRRATTPIERRVVESDLLDSIGEDDEQMLEVFAALLDRCPDEARNLLGLDDAPLDGFAGSLEVDRCRNGTAGGTVTNESDSMVDVRIEVQFEDANEVLLDTRTAWVRGLAPGATGRWESRYLGDDSVRVCRGRVDDVRWR